MSSEIKVSSVKAKDGTAGISIADSTGRVSFTETNPSLTLGSNTTFPAGHVIQTVQNTYNSADSSAITSTTTSRFVIADGSLPFTGQITNVKANSHVYITMYYTFEMYKASDTDVGVGLALYRESSLILTPNTNNYYDVRSGTSQTNQKVVPLTMAFIDTSPATGTNNYFAGGRAYDSASLKLIASSNTLPFICILQEIAQ